MAWPSRPMVIHSSLVHHISVPFRGSIWIEGMQVHQSALHCHVLSGHDIEYHNHSHSKCKSEETWFFLCFRPSPLFPDIRDLYILYKSIFQFCLGIFRSYINERTSWRSRQYRNRSFEDNLNDGIFSHNLPLFFNCFICQAGNIWLHLFMWRQSKDEFYWMVLYFYIRIDDISFLVNILYSHR